MEVLSENRNSTIPVNKTIFREGLEANYLAVKKRCKKENITVGALTLASCYMAQAIEHAKSLNQDGISYVGMKNQIIDIPVNVRRHLEPPIGDQYC